jgi:uncharacterized membrane protein SirB2
MPDNTALFTIMKSIHMITLTITITGFILRGVWMMRGSPLLQAKLVKIAPHVNDTVLLISAVWAGALIGQYPFVNAWLTAKILGAVAYIVLGAVALTYGRTMQVRLFAFVGALLCFAYVVAVAATKNPLLF